MCNGLYILCYRYSVVCQSAIPIASWCYEFPEVAPGGSVFHHLCLTGTMGLKGNLNSGEIIEQLVHANALGNRIRNVVFMVSP